MKIVYRAGDITEAEIVRGMLASNDIEAHVSGYYLQGGIGEMAPTDLAKVHVDDDDYESAKELIRAYEGNRSEHPGTAGRVGNGDSAPIPKLLITAVIVIVVAVLSYWVGI